MKNVYGESEINDYMVRLQGLIGNTFKDTENTQYTMVGLIDSIHHLKTHGKGYP
jgi:hypothetical protein